MLIRSENNKVLRVNDKAAGHSDCCCGVPLDCNDVICGGVTVSVTSSSGSWNDIWAREYILLPNQVFGDDSALYNEYEFDPPSPITKIILTCHSSGTQWRVFTLICSNTAFELFETDINNCPEGSLVVQSFYASYCPSGGGTITITVVP